MQQQHNHWDEKECSFCKENKNKTSLHEQLVVVGSYVQDLIYAMECEQKLKDGFKGMGYNIYQEKVHKKMYYVRQLKHFLGIIDE